MLISLVLGVCIMPWRIYLIYRGPRVGRCVTESIVSKAKGACFREHTVVVLKERILVWRAFKCMANSTTKKSTGDSWGLVMSIARYLLGYYFQHWTGWSRNPLGTDCPWHSDAYAPKEMDGHLIVWVISRRLLFTLGCLTKMTACIVRALHTHAWDLTCV